MHRTPHFITHFGFITLALLPLMGCPAPVPAGPDGGQLDVTAPAPTPETPETAPQPPATAPPTAPVEAPPTPALPGGPEGTTGAPVADTPPAQ